MAESRVKLECGHTRTVDHETSRTDCWSCGTVQAVVGTASA